MKPTYLTWLDIFRLGLVQTALGSLVVLSTSVLNRVLVVELALAAMVPGILVALHYAVQLSRPKWGHSSDVGERRTPWILGGLAVLGIGVLVAAACTMLFASYPVAAYVISALAFMLIGVGVAASGTSLLAFLAANLEPTKRPAAAASVWLMMIAGFIITTATVGSFLDPYSPARLIAIFAVVAVTAFAIASAALLGIEKKLARANKTPARSISRSVATATRFRAAMAETWQEPKARHFTIFVFVSMLAFSLQDLILEPFAGIVFEMSPGESTKLSGLQHSGVFAGMLLTGIFGSLLMKRYSGSMRLFGVVGCLMSAAALACLALGATVGPGWPLSANIALLGFANGVFAVAAIGSMMGLAGEGREAREGTRMGVWGAAQAIGFGLGAFLGTVAVDLAQALLDEPANAYASVFVLESLLFLCAAALASRVSIGSLLQTGRQQTASVMVGE